MLGYVPMADVTSPERLCEWLGRRALGEWYAVPLDPAAREVLARCVATSDSLVQRFGGLISAFWSGADPAMAYESLGGLLGEEGRERALLELVQGQLLMSRRLPGAMDHLDRGFRLAVPWLGARDYFRVLKRHELLRELPPAVSPQPPRDLDALLTEARVIRRLRRGRPQPPSFSRRDTLG